MSIRNNATGVLIEALRSPEAHRRCLAVQSLGKIGARAAVPPLMERLWDEDRDVSYDAVEALGRLRAEAAVPSLCEYYRNVPFGDLKVAAVEALGKIGGEEAVSLLLDVVRHREGSWAAVESEDWDDYWDAQLKAIEALGRLGAQQAVPIVLDVLRGEEGQGMLDTALRCLAALGEAGREALSDLLAAQDPSVRRRAVELMAEQSASAGGGGLQNLLDDPDATVRAAALAALHRTGASVAQDTALSMAQHPDSQVRLAAIDHLSLLPHEEPALLWARLLKDPAASVRAKTLAALGKLRLRGMTPHFRTGCNDPDQGVRLAAVAALEGLDDPEIVPYLLDLLQDVEHPPAVRVRAAGALERFRTAESRQALLNALADPEPSLRLQCLAVLARTENPSPVPLLLAALRGELVAPENQGLSTEQGTAEEWTAPQSVGRDPGADLQDAVPTGEASQPGNRADGEQPASAEHEPPEEFTENTAPAGGPATTLESLQRSSAVPRWELDGGAAPHPSAEEQEMLELVREHIRKNEQLLRAARPSPWQDVRVRAARLLGQLRAAEAVEPLIEALDVPEAALQQAAAHALGEIGDPRAVPELQRLLTGHDPDVQIAAIGALGRMRDQAAWACLLAQWPLEEPLARRELIFALANCEFDLCEPVFTSALEDDEPGVVKAAVERLLSRAAIGTLPRVLNALRRHPDFDWRGVGVLLYRCDPSGTCRAVLDMAGQTEDNSCLPLAFGLLEEIVQESDRERC